LKHFFWTLATLAVGAWTVGLLFPFEMDFPVQEDQFITGYCCHAWAMPVVGIPQDCDFHDPGGCSDPNSETCMCKGPTVSLADIPNGPPVTLACTVFCPGPFPTDPNTLPCTMIVNESGWDPNTHPVIMFKTQPVISSGTLGCGVHWIPGTLECDEPTACDFDFLP